jgi:hypothetical protein
MNSPRPSQTALAFESTRSQSKSAVISRNKLLIGLIRRIAPLTLGALSLACGPHFHVETPAGFVELTEPGYDYAYRATTAEGVVFAVRELKHEPQGDLAFWVAAIDNALRQRGGYALVGTTNAKTKSGLVGKTLEYGHDEEREPHKYFLTVYVTEKRIFVLEAGGKKTLTDARQADIEKFFREFEGS